MRQKVLFGKMNSVLLALLLVFPALLTGVGPAHSAVTQMAVVVTAAADYSSADHVVISVDPVGGPRTVQGADENGMLPTIISDITIAAYERYFYRIEKYQADNVTKFDIGSPSTPVWQFSTLDTGDTNSNPYDLVFVSTTKAYLLRYGTTKAWIVNPSATAEADFKTGELDLSSYADSDGIPEMHSGVIVDGKLFITLQRLDRDNGWVPTNTAYLAVFDTTADTEIDTGQGEDGLKGIPLPIKNLGAIQYLEENDTIYVQGVGDYGSAWTGRPAEYSGGIASVDPDTYETSLVLDDGDDTSHPYGNVSGMAIASATNGYFVGYGDWGDNTLYSFDPSTGEVSGAVVDYLKNKNIAGMETGVYLDQNNMLWVCDYTDAEVVILNTADNTIDEKVSTYLNPQRVVFANAQVIASLTASPTAGDAPLTVSFDATASSGTIVSYAWEFGDGSTGSGATTSHEYVSEGAYTVTLTVTDDLETTDTATTTITVEEDEGAILGCFIATVGYESHMVTQILLVLSVFLGLCLIGKLTSRTSRKR